MDTNKSETLHIVCFSGGVGSALVAIEVVRKHGKEHVVLVNHDINASSEDKDIKRFKEEVAAHLGLPITYANMVGWEDKDQFDVVVEAGAFKVGNGNDVLCTNRLKTVPFDRWLKTNTVGKDVVIYYGFGAEEAARIQRRSTILASRGYKTAYPLAHWPRTIQTTEEIGIKPPLTYSQFKHANCTGCLKAGVQHWYVVYCTRQDKWQRALWAEEEIGYTIIKNKPMASLAEKFEKMKRAGIPATEHIQSGAFWALVRKKLRELDLEETSVKLPCECGA